MSEISDNAVAGRFELIEQDQVAYADYRLSDARMIIDYVFSPPELRGSGAQGHVLLVDADVARPSLRQALGLAAGPGLLDLLIDRKTHMSDVLLRTNVDKLSVLLSGTPHPRATELLASDAMTSLIEEMGRRYPDRIIIFDSPPLLLTTEARVLATHMGQIIVVVQ
eukprot:gene58100-79578_t